MIGWLKLTDEQRKITLEQAAIDAGIKAEAIEKDWWVTLTLKALFAGKYKDSIVFKGGTSLSKCWDLIERFSEDIDIALDPVVFGGKHEDKPSGGAIDRLRKAGFNFTSTEFKADLENGLRELGIPEGMITVTSEPLSENKSYPDPQTLYVKYPSLFDEAPYIKNEVKVEISVRSLKEPKTNKQVQTMLNAKAPNKIFDETPFEIPAVDPHRTFLEKIFLLHEEFKKADKEKMRSERMSRHLYDLVRMMDGDAGKKALADSKLYATIIKHRIIYTKISGVDYETHQRETVEFIPPDRIIEAYRRDYETMRTEMIYGTPPSFEELIEKLKELTYRVRLTKKPPVVTIPAENPNYKFFKNYKGWKSKTWRVDLQNDFNSIALHYVNLIPLELLDKLILEIKIETEGLADENYKFPLVKLEKSAAKDSEVRLFMIDGQNPIFINLPQGRNWATFKIVGDVEIETYDLTLVIKYHK
jgi:hypothetical protein